MIFLAELKRNFRENLTYYPDFLSGLAMIFILFSMFMVLGTGAVSENYIGYAFWFLMSGVLSEASVSISYEKQIGTFEQLVLKPVSLIKILFIKSLVWGISSFIQVVLATVFVCLVFPVQLRVTWLTLIALIINFLGIVGFSMIFSGLTLKFTKIASFVSIIQYVLLFASGALIPVNSMPPIIAFVANLLPINLGLQVSREGFNLAALLLLALQSAVYLGIGMIVFNFTFEKAKMKGINSRY